MNEQINKRKKELNITNEKLSEISGVPLGTLSKITSGIIKNPKLSTLKQITDALSMTLDELVNQSEKPDKQDDLVVKFNKLKPVNQERLLLYMEMLKVWEDNEK